MLKFHLRRPPLLAWGAISLLVVSFTLAACGGAAPPATEAPAEAGETEVQVATETPKEAEAVAQSTSTVEKAESPTAAAPEEAEAEETPEQEAVDAFSEPATCEPLEVPVNEVISPVSDEDWAKGEATAAVTVVELGDFQ